MDDSHVDEDITQDAQEQPTIEQQIARIAKRYEEGLSLIGITLSDLPEETQHLLDECVRIQEETNIQDLTIENLQAYYYERKKQQLDEQHAVGVMKAEIKELEALLEKETKECEELEKFIKLAKKRTLMDLAMESNLNILEEKKENLQDKANALNLPQDINLDEIIKNIEKLESHKQKPK